MQTGQQARSSWYAGDFKRTFHRAKDQSHEDKGLATLMRSTFQVSSVYTLKIKEFTAILHSFTIIK